MPGPQRRLEFAEPPRYVDGLPRPGRALVMGVLNVTPDSFSDGGRYLDPAAGRRARRRAGRRGRRPRRRGRRVDPPRRRTAGGGRGARPGAPGGRGAGRRRRAGLGRHDARRGRRRGRRRGAVLVNDVSGGLADERMLPTVARLGVAYVLCTGGRTPSEMQQHTRLRRRGRRRVARAAAPGSTRPSAAGIDPARVAVDPGIGFSKTADQNWDVLRRLGAAARARPPGARRDQPQAVPGLAARRRLGRAAAAASCATTLRRPRRRSRPRPGRGASGRTTCGPPWTPYGWRTGGRWSGRPGVADRAAEHREVEAVNAAFYEAFESADLDTMLDLWLDDPDLCVHPGALPVRGTGRSTGPGR